MATACPIIIPGESTPTPGKGTPTQQVQWGWVTPVGPGNSRPCNIYKSITTPDVLNPSGSIKFTKPRGYDTIILEILCQLCDVMPAGEKIELNVLLGVSEREAAPNVFHGTAFGFVAGNTTVGIDKRLQFIFPGYSAQVSAYATAWFTRRNDSDFVPMNTSLELWIFTHYVSFANAENIPFLKDCI